MTEQKVQDAAAALSAAMAQGNKPGLTNLAPAFVAAWGEIGVGVKKDANNSHFNNDYATLEAVEAVVKPVLQKHGLAFMQAPGRIDGDKIEVFGLLIHKSGEFLKLDMQIALGGKVTAQSVGSAITYARRYQLMACFGLAPTDDDGEAASAPPAKPTKVKKDAAKSEHGEVNYAEARDQLIEEIEAFTGTVDQLSADIKPRVEELADAEVNKAYVAKRRELTGKKKGN